MKKILLVIVVLSLMAFAQVAHAVYLDSSWYAQVTNVMTWGVNPFGGGISQNSTHITTTGGYSTASFTIPQSGQAGAGEYASWGNTTLAAPNTIGPLSFDYTTYWTQPNLALVVESFTLDVPESFQVVWSSSRTGTRSGHVTINSNPNGYWFRLEVVPEPSGIMALGSLFGLGIVPVLFRRWAIVKRPR